MAADVGSQALSAAQSAESSRRVIRESLAAMRRQLLMDVAFVGRFHQGRRWFDYVDADAGFRPVLPGDSDPIEDSYCGWVADGRLPELIADTAGVPETRRFPATALLPVGAHLSVPLRDVDGRAVGTLCCFSRQPDAGLRDRDLEVVRLFSEVIGRELARVAAHDEAVGHVRELVSGVLEKGGPTMAIQPIVNLGDGSVHGYEALARFPVSSPWTADRWFAEAASVGLGAALQAAAVRNAIALLPALPADASMWVNLSPDMLGDLEVDAIIADEHASRLVVELAEHDHIADYPELLCHLDRVRARGARIAVDDAGAGYASLNRIVDIRPEVLKLDRELVTDIDRDPARHAMAEALVGFAAQVGAMIVAEGIETKEQLGTLRAIGVSHGQGYLLGRPQIVAGQRTV
jgi:EAL domain-containing protein (putative c-di-GMP-specific phosphodiesterase class I)